MLSHQVVILPQVGIISQWSVGICGYTIVAARCKVRAQSGNADSEGYASKSHGTEKSGFVSLKK